jgi:NADH dehydrogenase/NADH:ubiquinone oxidoreductase subunit G
VAEVKVTIDGTQVSGRQGMTILELAREYDIDIPTLCYASELSIAGACRLCVVELEGSRTLVGACHTPVGEGMVIRTDSPRVLEARRAIVDLLLASHSGNCFLCDKANICELRKIAVDLDVGLSEFPVKRRFYQVEDVSPYVERDLSKCVLCWRCIRACREVAEKNVFSTAYRGFNSKVVVDLDEPLNKEVCRDCYICVSFCPTGALTKAGQAGEGKEGKSLIVSG